MAVSAKWKQSCSSISAEILKCDMMKWGRSREVPTKKKNCGELQGYERAIKRGLMFNSLMSCRMVMLKYKIYYGMLIVCLVQNKVTNNQNCSTELSLQEFRVFKVLICWMALVGILFR